MLRNLNSRFSQAPMELDMPRSRFERDYDHKTTFSAGDLVPVFWDEVLPGDTVDLSTHSICRMATPIFPVMDNAYLETFFFFVPNRLIWDHWKEFNGENNDTYWTQPVEYNVPQLNVVKRYSYYGDEGIPVDVGGADPLSVADYLGLPTKIYSGMNNEGAPGDGDTVLQVNALPFRAYCKVWNDWFRDQNTMQPASLFTDDSDRDIVGLFEPAEDSGEIADTLVPTDPRLSAQFGGRLLKVSKYHDYFTSALPQPQKGPGVTVSGAINTTDNRGFPVNTTLFANPNMIGSKNPPALQWNSVNGAPNPAIGDYWLGISNGNKTTMVDNGQTFDAEGFVVPANLYAQPNDFSNVSLLVNDIRLAFQIQKLYEKDARGGTRYIEILKSHFGVDSPDGRLQRSEYLGGTRQAINVSQVVQTAPANENFPSPLGNTAAVSVTHSSNDSFIKSFTEHGILIGLACVRTDHTYQQGINRMFSRKRRFDYYWPVLANIGEQAILKKEILATGSSIDDQAFGYQEAWADYRYHPSMVTGAFRSNYDGTLDSWHYADYFDPEKASTMVIDEDFVLETPVNIDRTLAVQSSLEPQFIADFYFKSAFTRVMPLYSIPGLIDHH